MRQFSVIEIKQTSDRELQAARRQFSGSLKKADEAAAEKLEELKRTAGIVHAESEEFEAKWTLAMVDLEEAHITLAEAQNKVGEAEVARGKFETELNEFTAQLQQAISDRIEAGSKLTDCK